MWTSFDAARWCGVRDSAHEKLYKLLADPVPEVGATSSSDFLLLRNTTLLFSLYSFLLHVFLNVSPQFWSSYPSVYIQFHLLIATSSAVSISTYMSISVSPLEFSPLCLSHLPLLLCFLPIFSNHLSSLHHSL